MFCASMLALICENRGSMYHSLQPSVHNYMCQLYLNKTEKKNLSHLVLDLEICSSEKI